MKSSEGSRVYFFTVLLKNGPKLVIFGKQLKFVPWFMFFKIIPTFSLLADICRCSCNLRLGRGCTDSGENYAAPDLFRCLSTFWSWNYDRFERTCGRILHWDHRRNGPRFDFNAAPIVHWDGAEFGLVPGVGSLWSLDVVDHGAS